jgi:hypothetical protein
LEYKKVHSFMYICDSIKYSAKLPGPEYMAIPKRWYFQVFAALVNSPGKDLSGDFPRDELNFPSPVE